MYLDKISVSSILTPEQEADGETLKPKMPAPGQVVAGDFGISQQTSI